MSSVEKKLRDVENAAREARGRHKQTLRAVKVVREAEKVARAMKQSPEKVNLEFAIDGDISFDFDADHYPDLAADVLLLVEKVKMAAMERVNDA